MAEKKYKTREMTPKEKAARMRLNECARTNFADGQKPGDPRFQKNVDDLLSLMYYVGETWHVTKYYDEKHGVFTELWEIFSTAFTNAVLPGMSRKEKDAGETIFQKYKHEKNPGGDFFLYFLSQLKYKRKDLKREKNKDEGVMVHDENIEDSAEMTDGITTEDAFVEREEADVVALELASHIISLRKRIATGPNEEKRIANDQMFYTRDMVKIVRGIGERWRSRHDNQIFLSFDRPLLQYTYCDTPKDMYGVEYHALKRNIDIDPETTQSDAHEELKIPFALRVLARYLHEIQGRKLMRESAIHHMEEVYLERMKNFLQTKGITI